MSLTEAQIKEFNDKGFIVLKGFFDGPVMNKVSAWLDAQRDKKPAENEEAKYYEKSALTARISWCGSNIFLAGSIPNSPAY